MQRSREGTARLIRAAAAAIAASVAIAASPGAASEHGSRSGPEWMDEGYRRKATKDVAGAAEAFLAARASGFDPQRVDLELAYLSLQRGDPAAARRQLEAAASGPDPALAVQARTQLDFVPGPFRGDLYADSYGWRGLAGAAHVANDVPTVRLRAHYRPWLASELTFYLYAQATRDFASQGGALPRVYSDNHALFGPGVLLPVWGRRAGFFLQAGAAVNLVDDGRDRTSFDARGGAQVGLESRGCAPQPARGARLAFSPCADLYAETVWLRRFSDDVVLFARGRAGAGWLVTGPIAWQLLLETRGVANRVRENGDSFAEAGAWHRWRLLRPIRLDALVGVNTGRPLDLGRKPVRPGSYTELRLQLVTYVEF